MKAIKQFALTLIAAIVVVIGAEVAVVKAMGKEGLRELPFVGELFTVAESPENSKHRPYQNRCSRSHLSPPQEEMSRK